MAVQRIEELYGREGRGGPSFEGYDNKGSYAEIGCIREDHVDAERKIQ